ncbi:MAG: sigma 54-interacting transcriptional regulator, partial [Pseudohongiellaceae bacterium]
MDVIASDLDLPLVELLEGFDCPAILVSSEYQILATNGHYEEAFGSLDLSETHRCYRVSHGYDVPCDRAGEDCPLGAARESGHKERVLHIHQTPRGKEHVDVEMLPIHDRQGKLLYFVELLRPVPLASGKVSERELVGQSPVFQQMLERLARVAKTDAAALLLGETGTGKELAAKVIHKASPRKDKPLVTLECAGLTDTLFEAELFGHVKGAFTGAHVDRKGLVELADGGTLFLDELGDVPLSMQVKLLRLLETGTFRRVGSAEVRRSDFRLICATHKNLYRMVEEGTFRSDLYYRINVFPIHIPSLDERREDIPLLAKALLDRLAGSGKFHLTRSAVDLLRAHHYRGNIRELRNLVNRALVLTDSNVIDDDAIRDALREEQYFQQPEREFGAANEANGESEWVDLKTHEQHYLERILA